MKICLAVCEYNPLHDGHVYHLAAMRRELSPDFVAVIMSGCFTQRGEIAVMDKLTRARHALLSGADVVFELPAVFATANAEIFAKGAVKLLNELPGEKTLCFGSESGEKEDFLSAAKRLDNESREFKKALKTQLKEGNSFAKSRLGALMSLGIEVDEELLKSPNNILGVEYARAILSCGADIDIFPLRRRGGGYKDGKLYPELSSATAIRAALAEGKRREIKSNLPSYVYRDLPEKLPDAGQIAMYSLLSVSPERLAAVPDCTEGLENRFKACMTESLTVGELKAKVATKRYTAARIDRIITAAMLGIEEKFVRKCLRSELYLNVLGIKEGKENLLSEMRKNCKIPLITRKSDAESLRGTARECFEKDVFADDVWSLAAGKKINHYLMVKA